MGFPGMILRRSPERGHADHGWLRAAHTFSFAGYYDPRWVHFGPLRVLNQDWIAPGAGFPTHPHENMEIVTWVLSGSLQHEDSMGHGATLGPGDLQVMSAGRGLLHSEANPSATEPCTLLQMWVLPRERGGEPWYQDRHVSVESRTNTLLPVVEPGRSARGEAIDQDASFLVGRLLPGSTVSHELTEGRGAWLHVATGEVRCGEESLAAGDGVGFVGSGTIELEASEEAEVVLWDLPGVRPR